MGVEKQTGFDWETEDEKNPATAPVAAVGAGRRRMGQRRFVFCAATVIGIGLLAISVYRQLSRQAQIGRDQVVADVLLAHKLMEQAAHRGDRELFLTLLSPADGRWFAAQQTVFDQQLFLERTPLGLRLADDPPPPEAPAEAQVTLVADGMIAEVTGVYAYQAHGELPARL
jgi:hypothetical protein